MIAIGKIADDWEQWNGKEPNDQWQALENAGFITESGSQRPAPGVDEEGSGDGALGIEEFLAGNVARISTTNPVMPPSKKARPKAPYGAMPLESDPTGRGFDGGGDTAQNSRETDRAEAKPNYGTVDSECIMQRKRRRGENRK